MSGTLRHRRPPADIATDCRPHRRGAVADELLGLVLAGTKRATAGLVADHAHEREPLPRVGGHWIACYAGHLAYLTRTQEDRGEAWSDDL
jgi:hypothetical protein